MNQHFRGITFDAPPNERDRPCTPLDKIDAARAAQHLVAYTPSDAELARFFDRGRSELGSAIELSVIRRVMSANPDTVHALALRDQHDITEPRAGGFIAWLPLTASGLRALLDGTFDGSDPAPEHVAAQHEPPAAIYIWAIYAPGRLAAGIAWAWQRWSTPICRDADIYARGVTPNGRAFARRIGFEPCPSTETTQEHLYIFRRERDSRPLYDSYPSTKLKHTVTVVRTHDDLAKVMAIRAAVYMSGQDCPYVEEFDGNDFSATHLLGFTGDEVAACLRIRWFAGFAKLERVAVLPKQRRSRLAAVLVKAAHELCRMKGYTKVYGHAQTRLVDFWLRAGARPFPGAQQFHFSDHEYVEMLAEIPEHPDAITIGADPLLIIRPEGRWHAPGALDRSRSRPANCPETDRRTAR
ncbi:GNAT family N-acetyltransferase [Methylorubrum sp. SB2]|uniref:GNAT family N-acetyltransferase n=1 Tax=Methylorubrum subtropicum TaxID=3138812 RepID=UPI00313DE0D5